MHKREIFQDPPTPVSCGYHKYDDDDDDDDDDDLFLWKACPTIDA